MSVITLTRTKRERACHWVSYGTVGKIKGFYCGDKPCLDFKHKDINEWIHERSYFALFPLFIFWKNCPHWENSVNRFSVVAKLVQEILNGWSSLKSSKYRNCNRKMVNSSLFASEVLKMNLNKILHTCIQISTCLIITTF